MFFWLRVKKVLLKIYDFIILKWLDVKRRLLSKVVTLSIGDIMLLRSVPTHLQFGVASLLLDIEQYVKGDKSFRYQTEGKKLVYGENYDCDGDNARFSALIDSCMKDGFDNNSTIYVDKEIRLFNGTHRTAICLFMGINEIRARVLRRKEDYIKDISFNDIIGPKEYVIAVSQKLREIQEQIIDRGISFCCFFKGKDDNIESDICQFFHVNRIIEVDKVANSICGIDLIHGGKLFLFFVDNPRYKYINHCIESEETKEICHRLQEKYGISRSEIYISHSCYEGKKIYDALKPYFLKEDVVIK